MYSVRFNPVETHLLGATASDRSVLLYDMRGSAPLRKVNMSNPAYRTVSCVRRTFLPQKRTSKEMVLSHKIGRLVHETVRYVSAWTQ